MKSRHQWGWAAGALLGAASLAGISMAGAGDSSIAVTSGAAPDYVSDQSCALCHTEIARSYSEVGMARSFFRPRPANRSEDFSAPPFDHAPSRQRFQIVPQGEGLVFRRWQMDAEGKPARLFEQPVDWILGSGNHSRTYLYRTPDGALFQLPLAWYSQEKRWGMAPGYDRPDHDGVLRRVRRECLFCHNAYPEVPAGSDSDEAPHTFPAELPEGTGCQRCHGPGGEHLRRAMGGIDTRADIRDAIVNPAKLSPALRDDVCDQCHLLPIVALSGVRRAGRGDYSYRPGTPLPDYQVLVDADEGDGAHTGRFEIDHQSYRMMQSRCFTAAPGRLACVTCHDPHRRVPEEERAAHYRAACQECHAGAACKRPRSEVELATPGVDGSDCATCHLPKRRPRDVVHVLMTDHKIQRPPSGAALLALTAPLAESEPVLTGVRALEPARLPSPRLAEIHRTVPVVRTGASPQALEYLAKLLSGPPVAGEDEVPYRLELAGGLLRRRQYAPAEALLTDLLSREREANGPRAGRLWEWLGLARDGLGKPKEAEEALRKALASSAPGVDRAEVATRLAQILARKGRHTEAAELLTQAVAIRPNLAAAWYQLGLSQAALEKAAEARTSLETAMKIDPRLKTGAPP